jgi:hypothetical protein
VTAPLGIITAYDVCRQEINTRLPPLVQLLPNWHWAMWLSLLLLAIIFGLIFELYNRPKNDSEKYSRIEARAENGGIANAGNIFNAPVKQIVNPVKEKKEPPRIIAGLLDKDGNLSYKTSIYLELLPPHPDIEEAVKNKREKLFRKVGGITHQELNNDDSVVSKLIKAHIDSYPNRVELYLGHYRTYQKALYANSILDDRYKKLYFAVENRSHVPAHNVVINLTIPDNFPFPPKYVEYLVLMNNLEYEGGIKIKYDPQEPEESELYSGYKPFNPLNSTNYDQSTDESITTGNLKIKEKFGQRIIQYDIENLVQNSPDENFPSFNVWLGEVEKPVKMIIPVKITAEELPKPLESYIEIDILIKKGKK